MAAAEESRLAPWGKLVPFRQDHAHLNMYDSEYTIGRSKRCSLRLHDPQISGTHCTIRKDGSGVCIVDSSTNGTFVNGDQLTPSTPRMLHNGDQITLVQRAPVVTAGEDGTSQTPGAYVFYNFESRPSMGPPASSRSKPKITSLFELRTVLGTGSFGKVYLGRTRSDGKEVAVKMIRKRSLELSAHSMADVVEEANLMVKLRHPYLARLHSCWNDKDHIYLVMDLYRGGELFERVIDKDRGPYSEPQARTIALRLLLALQHLHERGIAHRDLKPENIMIADPADDTDVRIVDFGGAKQMSGSGMRTYVGSLQYMAPEVMRRKGSVMRQGRYDQSCDMWSLGIIVYVIISGYTPFSAETVKSARGSISWTFAPAERWAAVSSHCRDFIRSLLDVDPAERLAVDEALMHPWLEAGYKEWSLANPQFASDHAKLRFEIGGLAVPAAAAAVAEPLAAKPAVAAAAAVSSPAPTAVAAEAPSGESAGADAAVAAGTTTSPATSSSSSSSSSSAASGNPTSAATSGQVGKRERPTSVDSGTEAAAQATADDAQGDEDEDATTGTSSKRCAGSH